MGGFPSRENGSVSMPSHAASRTSIVAACRERREQPEFSRLWWLWRLDRAWPGKAPVSEPARAARESDAGLAWRETAMGSPPAGKADREIRAESVDGFLRRLALVFSVGGHTGQIDKLDQHAIVAAAFAPVSDSPFELRPSLP